MLRLFELLALACDPNPVAKVRNPLDRVLSHFRHHRRDHKLTNYSFATFAAASPPAAYWAANWYTQLLGGGGTGGGGSGGGCFGQGPACGEAALERALARLEGYFSVVLLADSSLQFRVGALLLRRALGWRTLDTDSSRRGTHVEVPPSSSFLCVCTLAPRWAWRGMAGKNRLSSGHCPSPCHSLGVSQGVAVAVLAISTLPSHPPSLLLLLILILVHLILLLLIHPHAHPPHLLPLLSCGHAQSRASAELAPHPLAYAQLAAANALDLRCPPPPPPPNIHTHTTHTCPRGLRVAVLLLWCHLGHQGPMSARHLRLLVCRCLSSLVPPRPSERASLAIALWERDRK